MLILGGLGGSYKLGLDIHVRRWINIYSEIMFIDK